MRRTSPLPEGRFPWFGVRSRVRGPQRYAHSLMCHKQPIWKQGFESPHSGFCFPVPSVSNLPKVGGRPDKVLCLAE